MSRIQTTKKVTAFTRTRCCGSQRKPTNRQSLIGHLHITGHVTAYSTLLHVVYLPVFRVAESGEERQNNVEGARSELAQTVADDTPIHRPIIQI